jgi:acyl carrier protein
MRQNWLNYTTTTNNDVMASQESIFQNLVLQSLNALREETGSSPLQQWDAEHVLFGVGGELDSLALVSLIVDIEARVLSEIGVSVVLADERAMSSRSSPFRTLGTLAIWLQENVAREAK